MRTAGVWNGPIFHVPCASGDSESHHQGRRHTAARMIIGIAPCVLYPSQSGEGGLPGSLGFDMREIYLPGVRAKASTGGAWLNHEPIETQVLDGPLKFVPKSTGF